MQHSDLICVKTAVGKGRGVFARKTIKKGQVIEHIPVLIIPVESIVDGLKNSHLGRYYYWWTRNRVAIALGFGSLYNHSYKPNAIYEHGTATIKYVALRTIKPGEEITINYNWDPKDKTPVGFAVVK